MYELIVTAKNKVIHNQIYPTMEDLQDFVYNLEKSNKKKRQYRIKSHLPDYKIVVKFD